MPCASTAYTVRPAVLSAVTALLMLVTAITSVALTLSWQSSWRTITRAPYVSEAHYDEKQSPVFVTMMSLTAALSALVVALTTVVASRRTAEAAAELACAHPEHPSVDISTPHSLRVIGKPVWHLATDLESPTLSPSSTADRSATPSSSRSSRDFESQPLPRPIAPPFITPPASPRPPNRRTPKSVFNILAALTGIASSLFLLLVGAVSIKLRLHAVFATISLISTLTWTIFVNLSLPPAPKHNAPQRTAVAAAMWLCSFVLIAAGVVMAAAANRNTSLVVVGEYVAIATIAAFFMLLAVKLSGSCIALHLHHD